ncbi:DUF3824 domain-containing protein [Knoellia sp. LjRoot47]|uniref:DUF3824 domain-containing protein n=1 Tax=Knoellia sp. LjRoot47 TaxID=3342330 RepID=UPI003ED05D64
MSQQYPPSGQGPYAGPPPYWVQSRYAGPPPSGAPDPYAGPPAYVGMSAPPARGGGLNPWLAGLAGAGVGAVLTVIAMTVLPMLFFGLVLGGGFMGDEGFMGGPPTGRVAVGPDGSVTGEALAEALVRDDDFYYEEVSCPATAKVATDETTICEGNDGVEDLRIVVVFDGTDGTFATADLW